MICSIYEEPCVRGFLVENGCPKDFQLHRVDRYWERQLAPKKVPPQEKMVEEPMKLTDVDGDS